MERVYTAGTFDTFHRGHVAFLRRCARIGKVCVGLNTDEFVELYKGQPPVIDYFGRAEVLRACRYVEDVFAQDSEDLRPQIEQVQPTYIVVGSDWARKDYYAQTGLTQDWLDERGITLCYAPYTHGVSSTQIRTRLRAA